MMYNWNGNHMSGWSYGLMTFGMLVFTGFVIFGVVLVVRNLAGDDRRVIATAPNSPEQVLADRYARGEIDAAQYRTGLETLAGAGRAPSSR